MPLISSFFGISIYMYFDDHNPPHFHAEYGDDVAQIAINPFSLMKGDLPPRVLGMVAEWASEHSEELIVNWNTLQGTRAYKKIEPLE